MNSVDLRERKLYISSYISRAVAAVDASNITAIMFQKYCVQTCVYKIWLALMVLFRYKCDAPISPEEIKIKMAPVVIFTIILFSCGVQYDLILFLEMKIDRKKRRGLMVTRLSLTDWCPQNQDKCKKYDNCLKIK